MCRKGRVPGTRWALLEMHNKQTAIIPVLRSQSILFGSLDQITRGQRIENSCAVLQKSVECLSSVPSLVIAEKTFFPRAIKSSCAHFCGLFPTTGNGNLLLTGQRSLRQLFDYLLWISFTSAAKQPAFRFINALQPFPGKRSLVSLSGLVNLRFAWLGCEPFRW